VSVSTERAREAGRGLRAGQARSVLGGLSRRFDLPLRTFVGRGLLAALFVVVPLFNPAFFKAGDERLYVGTVLLLAAALLMLPSLFSGRFDWILLGLCFGALYVAEAGVLRGNLSLGIVGNAYRPIHGVLAFAVCAVFLLGANRERWIRLFLWGGLVGCALAVLNTVIPAIDPFSISRPNLGYDAALFQTSRRQAGAFVYPGNFGPYAAYVALVGLAMVERKRLRLLSVNLYTLAFLFGTLGMLTSGSRGALIGFLVGTAVVVWRTPGLRRSILVTLAAVAVVGVAALVAAGTAREIYESRVGLAGWSVDERFRSWEIAWDGLRASPVFGRGVIPGTIDNTVVYYLGVGGLVGFAIVAAMFWVTLLRPVRFRDWAALPLVAGVAAVAMTQEALGTPLTSWAIGAGIFLLTTPGREREIFVEERRVPLVPPERRRAAIAIAGLLLAAGIGIGALVNGRLPTVQGGSGDAIFPNDPLLRKSDTIVLPGVTTAGVDSVRFATQGVVGPTSIWAVEQRGSALQARSFELGEALGEDDPPPATAGATTDARGFPGSTSVDVVDWGGDGTADLTLLAPSAIGIEVSTVEPGGEPVKRGLARVGRPESGVVRTLHVAVWDGNEPDLFVADARPTGGSLTVSIYSGESRFAERLASFEHPTALREGWEVVEVGGVSGSRPDVVFVDRRGSGDLVEVGVYSGESDFTRLVLHVGTDLELPAAAAYRFALGTRDDEGAIYAVTPGAEETTVTVLPIRYLLE
jgi:O-antigen ligase